MTTEWSPAGYVSTVLGTDCWAVAKRRTPTLEARYGTVITPAQHARIQAMFRCGYTAEAARYEFAD